MLRGFFERMRRASGGVGGAAADADVGVADEGDAIDDLLPGASEPRVFASHVVRVSE